MLEKIVIKVKRIHPDAKLPVYAHPGEDAGMDMLAKSLKINMLSTRPD